MKSLLKGILVVVLGIALGLPLMALGLLWAGCQVCRPVLVQIGLVAASLGPLAVSAWVCYGVARLHWPPWIVCLAALTVIVQGIVIEATRDPDV